MLKNLKIKYKLFILLAVFVIGFIVFGGLAYKTITDNKFDGKNYYEISLRKDLVADILPPPEYIIETHLTTYEMLNETNSENIKKMSEYINGLKSEYDKRHDYWVKNLPEGDMRKAMVEDSYKYADEYFKTLSNEFIPVVESGNKDKAKDILDTKLNPLYSEHRKYIDSVVEFANKQTIEIEKQARESYDKDIIYMIVVALAILLVSVAICLIIIRIITKPLNALKKHLKTVSTGDFRISIPAKFLSYKDELGDIAKAADQMQNSIKDIIGSVVLEAGKVNSSIENSSNHISHLNTDLTETSATVQEVSAGIEETSASTEELTSTISEIEKAVETITEKAQDGAMSSNEISRKAIELKDNANASQTNALEIRSNISKSMLEAIERSREVERIKELSEAILQISSQTNLLALNAAIEAARAGEAGKGFSVVAEEIRKLAEDSKNTVNEIQSMVNVVFEAVNSLADTSKKTLEFIDAEVVKGYSELVQTGENYEKDSVFIEELVTDLSATTQQLLASVKTVSNVMNSIAQASTEGSAATTDIAERVSRIVDKSGEVKKETESIGTSASKLKELVSKFKV